MKREFPHVLTVFVLAGTLVAGGVIPADAQGIKVGFVNIQRVVVGSKRGKDVLAGLQTERDAKQREVEAMEKEVRQMEADLEKQQSVLSEEAKRERERAIRDRTRDLRRTVEDLNRFFAEREQDVQQQLLREVGAVVSTYGKEKGYVLIFEVRAAGVIYGDESADLTNQMIAVYDAGMGKN